jgi:hypothetical protein
LIILIILGEEYKSRSSLLCNFNKLVTNNLHKPRTWTYSLDKQPKLRNFHGNSMQIPR